MSKRAAKKVMPSTVPRFDVDTLCEIAGDKVFARGVVYHNDKQVELIAIEIKRVSARVLDSEIYRTTLAGDGSDFSGECTCPAFSDRGFCKHLVATALTANALDPNGAETVNNRAPGEARQLSNNASPGFKRVYLGLADQWSKLARKIEETLSK